ncbi:MAG: hypothetical protein GXY88_07635 [Tissierellia bacterium]|nr:hypothetical protein [Tissierellia bacterium]
MIYLILSILCSVLITIIFKAVEHRENNLYAIISTNYASAVLISLAISIYEGTYRLININNLHIFIGEMDYVFKSMGVFSTRASAIWALLVGLIFGPIFCFAFFKYQKGIVESGMSIANTFMKISVIIPMLVSMIAWGEYPSIVQSLGIILCVASIIIFNMDIRDFTRIDLNKNLILLTFFGGAAQFTAKLYQK